MRISLDSLVDLTEDTMKCGESDYRWLCFLTMILRENHLMMRPSWWVAGWSWKEGS